MQKLWRREDVALGEVFTQDEVGVGGSGSPMLYQVVGINDQPTVVLRALDSDEPSDNEWYVIGSPVFAEFSKVVTVEPPWAGALMAAWSPERVTVDCPDCGAQAAIPAGGHCSVCQLDFQDLADADAFLDRLRSEAVADRALPSPREPVIPKDGRNG